MGEEKKESLPALAWMRSPIDVDRYPDWPVKFLPRLDERLQVALQNMGISSLFPVQAAVWHETIGPGSFDRDLCVSSPTGSGKTLAYALPIVQELSTCGVTCLRALVVLPTRDLAIQVKEVFSALAPAVGLSVGLAVGQSSISDEISKLIKRPKLEPGIIYDPEYGPFALQSSVDILVATPGRLMDHINTTKGFTLEHLCYLVVDETDQLLREAYQSWLPTVLQSTSSKDEGPSPFAFGSLTTIRRCGIMRGFKGKTYPRLFKMILSATMTKDPGKLAQLELHHPLFLKTGKRRYQLPKSLKSFKLICHSFDKPLYLVSLLQKLGEEKCIVFTSSVDTAHRLCTLLNAFSDLQVKIKEYSSGKHQAIRSNALKTFRKGDTQVLISSDALTHGMDVEGLKNVIIYDMPKKIKKYVHRAGRAARAGQCGSCFTLLCQDEVRRFNKLLKKADNDSCPVYDIPSESIECLRASYASALKKVEEKVEREASRKRKPNFKYLKNEKRRKRTDRKG